MMLNKVGIVFVGLGFMFLVVGGSACSKSSGDNAAGKLANLCSESVTQFQAADPGKDFDTFKLTMQNVISACGGACDKKDQGSCEHLEKMFSVLCKATPEICKAICSSVKSPSTKKYACQN
tara:strand:+ start:641 stop:1003 length:363 start_codon:yes stop_codon:yes gene_type:complete